MSSQTTSSPQGCLPRSQQPRFNTTELLFHSHAVSQWNRLHWLQFPFSAHNKLAIPLSVGSVPTIG